MRRTLQLYDLIQQKYLLEGSVCFIESKYFTLYYLFSMKNILKQRLTFGDLILIVTNLVPLWGVWFKGWDAKMIFIVYCFETIIAGIYTALQLWLTTLIKKKDAWTNGGETTMVSGYVFIVFFIIHYGFFVLIQMHIFLGILHIKPPSVNLFYYITHIYKFLPEYALWILALFTISYGLIVLKEFILTGIYKTIDMGSLMFAPYGRIFVQQFVVIIGSFILLFNRGSEIFILVFVIMKIFFGFLLDFEKIISSTVKKKD